MPRGKVFCPFENEFVPKEEFEEIEGTLIHKVGKTRHRATDGIPVELEDGKIAPRAGLGTLPLRTRLKLDER